jgi:chlorobactene glucosyltransferase
MLILSIAWLFAAVLLVSRALRQRAAFRELPIQTKKGGDQPFISIVVPARNEARNIERCIESLLNQSYPASRFKILAVDDNSADATAALIEKQARTGSVIACRAPPLPEGWTGKSHACWIAAWPAAVESDWLCFVDADIEACPGLVQAAISQAVSQDIDFLSLAPHQRLVSFAERLIMPCGLYLLAFSQNLSDVNRPQSKDITATGQFILIRSEVYQAIGGHKAVRADICEDLALARLAKSRGFRTALYSGAKLYSTRMYTGWADLWPGITKNLNAMLGGPVRTVATALVGLSLAWAAPLLAIAGAIQCHDTGACTALAFAAPASAAAFALHLLGATYFGIPFWYGLIFPAGYTIGAVLALDSVRRRITGRIRWKDRTYP